MLLYSTMEVGMIQRTQNARSRGFLRVYKWPLRHRACFTAVCTAYASTRYPASMYRDQWVQHQRCVSHVNFQTPYHTKRSREQGSEVNETLKRMRALQK